MNPDPRAELLASLADLCQRFPRWRLGRLLCHVSRWTGADLWDVEDDRLLEAMRQVRQQPLAENPAPCSHPAEVGGGDNALPPGWFDGARFNLNANRFPEEKLVPYRNKHIAWNRDA